MKFTNKAIFLVILEEKNKYKCKEIETWKVSALKKTWFLDDTP